jgi:hypothetical protein
MPFLTCASDFVYMAGNTSNAIVDTLPAGVYTLDYNKFRGWLFTPTTMYTVPETLYGNTVSRADRVMQSFNARSTGLGVLLSGRKGAGKSLLAKLIALRCIEAGIPVVTLQQAIAGQDFTGLITAINQPLCVFVDEFEKLYIPNDNEETNPQAHLLTLLDGVTHNDKRLWLFTANSSGSVHEALLGRPSRIFYNFKYKGLDPEVITEYCKDNLKDKSRAQDVLAIGRKLELFEFDGLKSVVEEINRYPDITTEEIFASLNLGDIKYTLGDWQTYQMDIEITPKATRGKSLHEIKPSVPAHLSRNYMHSVGMTDSFRMSATLEAGEHTLLFDNAYSLIIRTIEGMGRDEDDTTVITGVCHCVNGKYLILTPTEKCIQKWRDDIARNLMVLGDTKHTTKVLGTYTIRFTPVIDVER